MPTRSLPELVRTAIAMAFLPASRSRSVPRYTVSPTLGSSIVRPWNKRLTHIQWRCALTPPRLATPDGSALRLIANPGRRSPTGPSAVRACAPGSTGEKLQRDFALLAARVAIEPPRSSTSSRSRTAGMRAGGFAGGRTREWESRSRVIAAFERRTTKICGSGCSRERARSPRTTPSWKSFNATFRAPNSARGGRALTYLPPGGPAYTEDD